MTDNTAAWQTDYDAWTRDKHPGNMSRVIASLQPHIDLHLGRMGMRDDPLLAGKARVLAATAVKTYDASSGASLPSWLGTQLLPLQRFKRDNSQVIRLPERVQLDAMQLERARQQFRDQHDREPDQLELADASGLSVRRIGDIQTASRSTPSDSSFPDGIAQNSTDFLREAADIVYREEDRVGRLLMEGRTGYNGAQVLPVEQIMQRTKLAPYQISRRCARLAQRISALAQDLEGVYAK